MVSRTETKVEIRVQKTVRETAGKIYPDIIWRSKVYEKEGKHCVHVEIEYSGETPHFGGPAWVRRGSESVKASDEVFQRLIDYRTSKVWELAKWLDRPVTFSTWSISAGRAVGRGVSQVTLRGVNGFFATFELGDKSRRSEPLDGLSLSWDHAGNRLAVEHKPQIP